MSVLYLYACTDLATNQWAPVMYADLTAAAPGGGSGGDASAANQAAQIALETAIRDRLPATLGAQAGAQSMPVALSTADKTALDAVAARLPAAIGPQAAAAALATVAAPFTPTPGSTASHACSTTPLTAVACTPGQVLRFGHTASGPISVAFGASTIAASITAAAALDVYPGCPEAFTVPPGVTHWSAVMASGTGTLKCTTGAGG